MNLLIYYYYKILIYNFNLNTKYDLISINIKFNKIMLRIIKSCQKRNIFRFSTDKFELNDKEEEEFFKWEDQFDE